MKFRNYIAALAAFALALGSGPFIQVAEAASPQALMCQGDVSGASTGARTIGGTNSAVPSGTLYVLNSNGCALITNADIGYFQSQGYIQNSSSSSVFLVTGALPASGTADIPGPSLPAGAYLTAVIINNTTANAVTGGITIGSTANGTDIAAAITCAANCVANAALLKTAFSTTAPQVLHFAPVTSSNTANLTITVVYSYF